MSRRRPQGRKSSTCGFGDSARASPAPSAHRVIGLAGGGSARQLRAIAGKHLRPLFADMRKCAAIIIRHLDGILGHWVRGFLSTENLITMLYFTAARLDLPVFH